MENKTVRESVDIDGNTSRSICEAVGERLQRELPPELSHSSGYLQDLLDELRRHDQEIDLH